MVPTAEAKRARTKTLQDISEVTGQPVDQLREMLHAREQTKKEEGASAAAARGSDEQEEVLIDDLFADLTRDKIEEVLMVASRTKALESRLSRVETILHEVVTVTYKNMVRLISVPQNINPRAFHDGMEAIMKGLLGMPNVVKVRAGARHVDLDLAIMYNVKNEIDNIKKHLRDKHITRLKMGPPPNPEANIYRGVPKCAFKAWGNVWWWTAEDQDDKLPEEAQVDTRWPQAGDQVPKFSLTLKNGEVFMNGEFDKNTGIVTIMTLESVITKGLTIKGKDFADELNMLWSDASWSLVVRVVARSVAGLELAPLPGKGKGKGKDKKQGSKSL